MASLGANFQQLMMQAAEGLPPNTINETMVGEVARQLDSLQGLMAFGTLVDPVTGHVRNLTAGNVFMNEDGLRVGEDIYIDDAGIWLQQGGSSLNQLKWFYSTATGGTRFPWGRLSWSGTTASEYPGGQLYTGLLNSSKGNSFNIKLDTEDKPVTIRMQSGGNEGYITSAGMTTAGNYIFFLGDMSIFNHWKYDVDHIFYGTTEAALTVDAGENKIILASTSGLSSNATGSAGMVAVDSSYIYVHDSTEWRRAALSTF